VDRINGFLRQHVIALLALALVVGGGAAFAGSTQLPKNSVASKQVKNGSLKGKDLKNGSVKGADLRDGTVTGADLADGSVTGADLGDGSVTASDLAPGTVDEVRTVFISSADGIVTLFDEAGIGKITFGVTCSPTYTVSSFAAAGLSPARAGSYGLEQFHAPGEAADSTPLIGAATVSRLGDVGQPTGGAGFGGGPFGFGELVLFTQSSTKDVYARITTSYCSARAVVSIDNKPKGSVLAKPAPGSRTADCQATGVAYCSDPAA
jgi:hypothetical protein